VVTDSACSLPAELASDHHISIVPMGLTIGGTAALDGEVTLEEVTARLGEGLSTSGPAPGRVAEAVEAADEGDGVIVLTISSEMSSTYDSARLAVQAADGAVALVDTGTAAGAEGLVVLAAARCAQAGGSLGDVEAAARRASAEVRLVATLPSLDALARGGRVPQAAAWAGRWLGLNPMFEFRSGHVHALRPALGRDAAYERIVSQWHHTRRPGAALHAAVMHALDPDGADHVLSEVRRRHDPDDVFVGSFSAVMVSHTGPGLVGLAWWWEDR
jgi:DegV family protein with EDD domain